jgi:hypothetical protein
MEKAFDNNACGREGTPGCCGAHELPKSGSGERIVFLPAEMLGRKK